MTGLDLIKKFSPTAILGDKLFGGGNDKDKGDPPVVKVAAEERIQQRQPRTNRKAKTMLS